MTVSRVRGWKFAGTELEGEFAGKKVPYVLMVCEVVLDNRTGEDLVVSSHFHSAFDGLGLVLLREGQKVVEQSYLHHQSPYSIEPSPFVLKKGKNHGDMRFPIRLPPADWGGLQAQIIGSLPGSKFAGKLAANIVPVQRVADLD